MSLRELLKKKTNFSSTESPGMCSREEGGVVCLIISEVRSKRNRIIARSLDSNRILLLEIYTDCISKENCCGLVETHLEDSSVFFLLLSNSTWHNIDKVIILIIVCYFILLTRFLTCDSY